MKAVLEITGAVLTLLGVVIGVYGTYLMTKFSHPFGPLGFTISMARTISGMMFGERENTKRYIEIAGKFAALKEQDKGESFVGLHWLFFGFFLQTLGAILIMIDVAWLNVCVERHLC